MFLSKADHHRESEIPTSSLADIVFLLLIFFLVTTSIDTGKAVNLMLPKNDRIVDINPNLLFSIYLNNQSQIAVEGVPASIGELKRKLKKQLTKYEDAIISLKTGANTNYQVYIEILDAIKGVYGDKTPHISIVPPDVE